ncbi:G/T mismatch-specific thymine DNA glycosylase-like [Chelonus insularis]|uniref:G/T mismatch-specific thymine DNA glycosylase-like n=1 Tax=Chelonus insularis TaxID=460826 RepID=UPI00158F4C38|nr:G/T mismatch-specific thymine DNA glycosylase-like [Chelonus insularis]
MIKLIKLCVKLKQFTKFISNQYNSKAMSGMKNGRFNGLTEEEVKKKDPLPDYLEPDLDIVFLGINPSLMAAFKGRYYAGPGNHFYKLLHASGLVPQFVSFEKDCELLKYKIGLTNIVDRATRSSADLTATEIKEGCNKVVEKLKFYKPKIAVFNGKCIYQVYARQLGKTKFDFGLQSEKISETAVWVVPSSSARCSNFPRMTDKLHFYQAINKHLQYLKGIEKDVDVKQFYSMNQGLTRPKKDKSKKSVQKECSQFVITEILDGSQKFKETNDEEKGKIYIEDNEDLEENEEYSCDSESSISVSDNDDKPSLNLKPQESKLDSSHQNLIKLKSVTCGFNDSKNDEDEKKIETNLKRNWKDTQTISSSRRVTVHDERDEVNSIGVIKQRLVEKNEENVEVTKNTKKLNFSNLRRKKS